MIDLLSTKIHPCEFRYNAVHVLMRQPGFWGTNGDSVILICLPYWTPFSILQVVKKPFVELNDTNDLFLTVVKIHVYDMIFDNVIVLVEAAARGRICDTSFRLHLAIMLIAKVLSKWLVIAHFFDSVFDAAYFTFQRLAVLHSIFAHVPSFSPATICLRGSGNRFLCVPHSSLGCVRLYGCILLYRADHITLS